MPVDRFSGKFVVKSREQIRNEYLVDVKFRQPDADVSKNSLWWVKASTVADALMPLYFDAKKTASVVDIDNAVGAELDIAGEADGLPRLDETTAQGYVEATASVGGGTVIQGQRLRHLQTRALYQVLVTQSVSDGGLFAIASLATGAEVNLQAGAVLEFESPPVGLGALVTVTSTGIVGGGPEESDGSYLARIKDARANPAAAANWAHYAKTVESVGTVNVEKAFVTPAIAGPGTVGIVFTTKPDAPGGSRLPNGAQIATVEASTVDGEGMPVDDGALFGSLADHDVAVVLRMEWAPGAPGWVDTSPWPPSASPAVRVGNSMAISATAFEVEASGAIDAPTAGKTIALWDNVAKKLVAKRITAVVVNFGNSWFIETDSSAPTSDAVFVPTYLQRVSPWADSGNDIAPLIIDYMDKQGPGEQIISLPDPNGRQRRHPISPWPHVITGRALDEVFDLSSVSDVEVLEPALPFPTTVGTAGVLSYLHRLTDFALFSEE